MHIGDGQRDTRGSPKGLLSTLTLMVNLDKEREQFISDISIHFHPKRMEQSFPKIIAMHLSEF